MFKHVNSCVAVDFRLELENVNKAIKYMVEKYGSNYILSTHITLLQMPMPRESFAKVKKEINAYIRSLKPFEVTVGDLFSENNGKYWGVKIKGDSVIFLHKKLLSICNPFRGDAIREKDVLKIEEGKYKQDQLNCIKRYGFPFAGELYNPHITVGKVNNELNEDSYRDGLLKILGSDINKNYVINSLTFLQYTDAEKMSDMVETYKKTYVLG